MTKRLLGLLMLIFGAGGFCAIVAIDLIRPAHEGGIGPAQQIALIGCAGLAIVGLTLIPLGNDPA
ncbi:MAG: hypothetical protein IAE80_08020 [Anaerolinea sp.]|nr:hypothetical protein [Anaerolinea sp.]